MINKFTIITILICSLLCSCARISFLPKANEVHSSPYGCHIKVKTLDKKVVKGELIAVFKDSLYISTNYPDNTSIVNKENIKNYVVRFANGETMWWSILTFPLIPLVPFPDPNPKGDGSMPFHGFFLMYTIPINLLVTSIVTPAAYHEYKLKELKYDELAMYARYPQGFSVESIIIKEEITPPLKKTDRDTTGN